MLFLIWLGFQIVFGLAGSVINMLTNMSSFLGGIISIAFICGVIFASVRLLVKLSLAMPAAIGARRIGIVPGWEATDENELRLVGYGLCWAALAFILQLVTTAILVPEALGTYTAAFSGSEEARAASARAVIATLTAFDVNTPLGILRTLAAWILNTAQTVIGIIAVGVAWRMLTDGQYDPDDAALPRPAAPPA